MAESQNEGGDRDGADGDADEADDGSADNSGNDTAGGASGAPGQGGTRSPNPRATRSPPPDRHAGPKRPRHHIELSLPDAPAFPLGAGGYAIPQVVDLVERDKHTIFDLFAHADELSVQTGIQTEDSFPGGACRRVVHDQAIATDHFFHISDCPLHTFECDCLQRLQRLFERSSIGCPSGD